MARQRNGNRRQRTPFGVPRLKMSLDASTSERLRNEGKVPRWINDEDNRIWEAQQGDYEFVENDREPIKTGDAEEVQEQDRRVRKQVGKNRDGSPKYAYLMAIPEEYYEEDQQSKEERNQKVDQSIRGGNPPGLQHHGVDSAQGGQYVKNVDYKP